MEWVNTPIDAHLLRAYTDQGSEDAFAELVRRHMDWVYSASLRMVRDPHLAEDVTQAAFVALARSAPRLADHPVLSGWLHRTAQNIAVQTVRATERRRSREQQAAIMNELLDHDSDATWKWIAPHLDDALGVLSDSDRDALTLRYFERKSAEEMSQVLGISSEAAQKRVNRAVDRLRDHLTQRGITSTSVGLALAMESHAVASTPLAIAESILRGTRGSLRPSSSPSVISTPVRLRWSWAVALLFLVGIGGLMWTNHQADQKRSIGSHADSAAQMAGASGPTSSGRYGSGAGSAPSEDVSSSGALDQAAEAGKPMDGTELILSFVTKETGEPVPNVKVGYRGFEGTHFTGTEFLAARNGEARIRIVPGTTHLELTSMSDGFADTRLTWDPEKGDRIPDHRKVRLERAILIGGRVLDPSGNPVSDAKVGWNHNERPGLRTSEESHEFGWIQATTDEEGRWRIHRIAASMLPSIYGSASHPEFQPSKTVGYPYPGQPGLDHAALESELKALKHVFRLEPASSVEGQVVEESGAPIAGAQVRVGPRRMSGSQEGKTDSDGRFYVRGGPTGKTLVTAEAKGFGAKTLPVVLKDRNEPVRIVLSKAVPLRIRVVDTNGTPVPKAYVWLNTMSPTPSGEPEAPLLQASFEGRTDAEGRTVWEDAPPGIHDFDVEALGFMRQYGVKVAADGEEHDVVLSPALVLQGAVTDAATGKPIPRFRLALGWPEADPLSGRTQIQVSGIERLSPTFSGGRFRHVLGETVLNGVKDPRLMVRFEADGYRPHTSREIRYDEGVVTLDVALETTETVEVTVVDVGGRPVAGAQVGLVSPGSRIALGASGLVQTANQGVNALLRTDAQGRVKLQGNPERGRIVVAGDAGFAETQWERLQADPVVRLDPWGRIQGRMLGSAGSREGKVVTLARAEEGGSDFVLDFHAQTDAEGRFTFPRVPAGTLWVEERIVTVSGNSSSSFPGRSKEAAVPAGGTVEVELGGNLRVTGRLTSPERFRSEPDVVWTVRMESVSMTPPPPEIRADPAAFSRWMLRRQRDRRTIPVAVDAQGGFTVDGVEPGAYALTARKARRTELVFPGGFLEMLVTRSPLQVPEVGSARTGGVVDLGEVRLEAPPSSPGN